MLQRVLFGLCTGLVLFSANSHAASKTTNNWPSRTRFRVILSVEGLSRKISNRPAVAEMDFQKWLGTRGTFDEGSVQVIPVGKNRPVPHRLDPFFGASAVTLNFVIPDDTCGQMAVYFDTMESKHAGQVPYAGLVGDGDHFCQGFGKREIASSHFDSFVDFDGDGDLDLFKGGVEPFVYCYENAGRNRMVSRGKLASEGKAFKCGIL